MRYLAVMALWLTGAGIASSVPQSSQSIESAKLAAIADEFKTSLAIPGSVELVIVKKNRRLASVRPSPERRNRFLLEIDETFLQTLSWEEKRAVIAHEMGHVWIFTHHPYLQTEALANEKAQQLISSTSLARVYEKVWEMDGRPGSLDKYVSHRIAPTPSKAAANAVPALLESSQPERDDSTADQ